MLTKIQHSEKITIFASLLAAVLLGTSLAIFLARGLVTQILVALAANFLSPDGVVTGQGLLRIQSALDVLRWICLAGGLGVFAYGYLYQAIVRRLQVMPQAEQIPEKAAAKSEYLWLGAILALALLLRLTHLNRGFFYDELFTTYYFVHTSSWWDTISRFIIFNNHIFYSVLARLTQSVFGPYEWAIRLPALLMGLGSIYLAWSIARREFGKRITLLAAFLIAISPTHVLWSVSARGYTGLIFFALLSIQAFTSAILKPRLRAFVLFVLASTAAIYTHLHAIWVIAGEFLYFSFLTIAAARKKNAAEEITQPSFKGFWLSFAAIAVLTALLYLPVLNQIFGSLGTQSGRLFQPLFPLDFIKEMSGDGWIQAGLAFVAVVFGVIAVWKNHPVFLGITGCILVPAFLVSWLILRPQNLYPRFFSYMLPHFLILAGLGIQALWRWAGNVGAARIGYTLRAVMVGASVFMLIMWLYFSAFRIPEEAQYRNAIQALTEGVEPSATLCVFGADAEIFQFYTDRNLVFPKTQADLSALLASRPELRCAYHDARWNPPEFVIMAGLLAARSDVLSFKKMLVYTVHP